MAAPPLRNNGWLTVPWAEFIGKDGSHGSSFQSDWNSNVNSTFNILINFDDAEQAEQDLLGTAVFDPVTNTLSRTPPVQHPLFTDMRCEKILSAHPIKWDEKKSAHLPYAPGAGGSEANYSEYKLWLLNLGFSKPLFTILTDTDLQAQGGGEWNRYTFVNEQQKMETVTREAGAFCWDASAPPGLAGQEFNAPIGQHFYSSTIEVTWVRVPRVGLYANGGLSDFLIDNIRDNYGKVHDGTIPFWETKGNANGSTLRLVGVNVEPYASPFSPQQQGVAPQKPNTYHAVKFRFHQWNPPSGDGVNFGHNLAPNPAFDGKWYLVRSTGRIVTDGVLNGTTTVTSATANFTSSDIGTVIIASGIPANTTITAVGSSSSVTLSASATTSGSGVTLRIGCATIYPVADLTQVFQLALDLDV